MQHQSNWLLFACCALRRFLFHQLQMGVAFVFFLDLQCTKPPNPSTCPCFSGSYSIKLSHTTTVGPSSSPQNFKSPRPADWKNGGADINALPSSLLALLIFCSSRGIDHGGDLPSFFLSSVRLVSSWMTVISSCSRSNHRFCKKIQLLLAIVHPMCGSMHAMRPSVVLRRKVVYWNPNGWSSMISCPL